MNPTAGSESPEPSDDVLARRCRNGDADALAHLYRRHAGTLLAYLGRIAGPGIDPEDVLHDAFLRVFEGRGIYESRGRFRSWLFTIATRLVRDRRRRITRHAELERMEADRIAPEASAGADAAARLGRLTARIRSALDGLPPTYAEAFHLRVAGDLSYREMARLSGEPEGTLRSRVFHAVKAVRRALEGDAADERSSDER